MTCFNTWHLFWTSLTRLCSNWRKIRTDRFGHPAATARSATRLTITRRCIIRFLFFVLAVLFLPHLSAPPTPADRGGLSGGVLKCFQRRDRSVKHKTPARKWRGWRAKRAREVRRQVEPSLVLFGCEGIFTAGVYFSSPWAAPREHERYSDNTAGDVTSTYFSTFNKIP